MPVVEWASEAEKAREWAYAKEKLIVNGKLLPNGTKLRRTDSLNGLSHSFLVIDNQIIALSGKDIYLGRGLEGQAKLAENEKGELIALKIMRHASSREAEIARDLGIAGELTRPINSKHADKHYVAYQYLGISLHKYFKKKSFTLDESYQLSIKIALALHDLHVGNQSKTGTSYGHNDVHWGNIVIDEQNEPHFIDFGKAFKTTGWREDLVEMLLMFFTPIKDRTVRYSSWIFGDWLGEYKFSYPSSASSLEDIEKYPTQHTHTIYVYIDPSDKKPDGSYSTIRYKVIDSGVCKTGSVSLDGLELPQIIYKDQDITEERWVEWQLWDKPLSDSDRAKLEGELLKTAVANGHIRSKEDRSELLFNLFSNPKKFYKEPCPSALSIAATLTLCRFHLEAFQDELWQSEGECREILHHLNLLSSEINSLYESLRELSAQDKYSKPLGQNIVEELRTSSPSSALRAPSPHAWGEGTKEVVLWEEFYAVKKYIMAQLSSTINHEESAEAFQQYLATIPPEKKPIIEKAVNELLSKITQIKAARAEQILNIAKAEQEAAAQAAVEVTKGEMITSSENPIYTEAQIAECNLIVNKLQNLTQDYLNNLSASKKQDIEPIVNKLLSILKEKNAAPKKIQKFYEFLDAKHHKDSISTRNIDIIKRDTSASGLKVVLGIALIYLSLATLPISVPIMGLIYWKTGRNLFDLFKSESQLYKEAINRIKEKNHSYTLFSSHKENLQRKEDGLNDINRDEPGIQNQKPQNL